jgi:hypothetical protein
MVVNVLHLCLSGAQFTYSANLPELAGADIHDVQEVDVLVVSGVRVFQCIFQR